MEITIGLYKYRHECYSAFSLGPKVLVEYRGHFKIIKKIMNKHPIFVHSLAI